LNRREGGEMIIAYDREFNEFLIFKNIKQLLKEINRDRSSEWTDYNEEDWREGLEEFTSLQIISENAQMVK